MEERESYDDSWRVGRFDSYLFRRVRWRMRRLLCLCAIVYREGEADVDAVLKGNECQLTATIATRVLTNCVHVFTWVWEGSTRYLYVTYRRAREQA